MNLQTPTIKSRWNCDWQEVLVSNWDIFQSDYRSIIFLLHLKTSSIHLIYRSFHLLLQQHSHIGKKQKKTMPRRVKRQNKTQLTQIALFFPWLKVDGLSFEIFCRWDFVVPPSVQLMSRYVSDCYWHCFEQALQRRNAIFRFKCYFLCSCRFNLFILFCFRFHLTISKQIFQNE